MGNGAALQEILQDAKIGWWRVDTARQVLVLSDYLCKTIGCEESEISYDRFLRSVSESFRTSLGTLMVSDASLFLPSGSFRYAVLEGRYGSAGRFCGRKRHPATDELFLDTPRKSARSGSLRSIFIRSSV